MDPQALASKTVEHRLGCISRAQSAIYQRMKQLGLHQEVMLMADMFDIAAKSAGVTMAVRSGRRRG
jgi:hypothetical protein